MYRDDLIRAEMGAQKLSREAVARKAKLHVNTVRAICKGKPTVQYISLFKVAKALRLDMEELVTPRRAA